MLIESPDRIAGHIVAPSSKWYALHVRSRHEKLTAALLRDKGLEEFLPLYRSRRRWSDRLQVLDVPLFPGYVFCRFEADKRLPILVTPGVVDIVGLGKVPVAVPDNEIAAIQAIVRSGLPAEPWPYLKVGSRVRIDYGSLSGLEGILVEVKSRHRLVLSVSLLQRSVSVEIDRAWVCPGSPVNRRTAELVA